MKTSQKIGYSVAALLIIAGSFLVFKRKKTKGISTINSEESIKSDASLNYNKTLVKGSSGPEVVKLQTLLGDLGADGKFGPLTEEKLFQKFKIKTITLNQYYEFLQKLPSVNQILTDGKTRIMSALYGFDLAFLNAWAKASKNKAMAFAYGFDTFDTTTGKKYASLTINKLI